MPENVILDGGLDLIRARPAVLAGRIRECLNYEVGYRRGNTRIDGFERFDGTTSPSNTTGWVLEVHKVDVTGLFTTPEDLVWTLGVDSGNAGTLVQRDDAGANWRLFIIFRTGLLRPTYDAVVTGEQSGASFVLSASLAPSIKSLPKYYATHEEYIEALHSFAEILRTKVLPVPGVGTILGLHFHEDQLYAVRDIAEVTLTPATASSLEHGQFVYNDADQVGEVVTLDGTTGVTHIAPVDTYGFEANNGAAIHSALTVRFTNGTGAFPRNHKVKGLSSGWEGLVGHIRVEFGSFAAGDAEGIAAFMAFDPLDPASVATLGETFQNQIDGTSTMVVSANLFASGMSVATVETLSPLSDIASLWRSSEEGWVGALPPRYLRFQQAAPSDVEPPLNNFVREVRDGFLPTTVVKVANGYGPTPAWTGALTGLLTENAAGPNYTAGATITPSRSDVLRVAGFNADLAEGEVLYGIRLYTRIAGFSVCPATSGTLEVKLASGFGGRPTYHFATGCGGAWPVAPYPSVANTAFAWNGGQEITREMVNDPAFGFDLQGVRVGGAAANFSIDVVRMSLTVDVPVGSTLYLWDPINAVSLGTLSAESLVLESGGWDTDDAAGRIRLDGTGLTNIPEGTEIRTAPGGAGNRVAVTSGSTTTLTLPGSRLLRAHNSRYQFISHNFYASEDRNAIYGVSGAGPAFWYDGTTLDFIFTGVDEALEKPRHLAVHLTRLHLGYPWGEVYASAPGDPLNFAGEDFAATYGFGDKITGLMPAAGDVLAVFTESATHALAGANGDDANPPRQTVINHRVGAIEYTVQNVGNRPIFTSFRGIETLETMDQFGDLFTAPLTHDIAPFLLRRLQTAAGVEAANESVVNSVVVRNKNQYRLFFADGYVVTLTQVGPEREPQNTIQRYYFNDDQRQFARVFATASGVTSDGRDRAFFSVEERPNVPDPDAFLVTLPETDFVYELDRGRSFDGGEIASYFTMTHYFSQQQQASMVEKRYNVVQLHGECPGYAGIRLSRAMNYEDMDLPELPHEDIAMGALSHPPEDQAKPKYTQGRLSGRGFAVSLRVSHESRKEFPHAIQMITFLDDAPLRPNR